MTNLDYDGTEQIIDAYQALRGQCYRASQANDGKLMGASAWLRSAINENELQLSPGPTGIDVHGSTYTVQTMSNEWFDFFLTFEDIARF